MVVLLFGTAWNLSRTGLFLLASTSIPLGMAIFSGVFVYRHTARRRRLQAIITVLLSVLLIPAWYLSFSVLFPERLYIPNAYDVRQAR